jgi:hypothetical protein
MNWFRIEVQEGKDEYICAGSSPLSLEELVENAMQGKYVRLDDLFYIDRGDIKDWNTWDGRVIPMVQINPKGIIAIQQYKGDPRALPKQPPPNFDSIAPTSQSPSGPNS